MAQLTPNSNQLNPTQTSFVQLNPIQPFQNDSIQLNPMQAKPAQISAEAVGPKACGCLGWSSELQTPQLDQTQSNAAQFKPTQLNQEFQLMPTQCDPTNSIKYHPFQTNSTEPTMQSRATQSKYVQLNPS